MPEFRNPIPVRRIGGVKCNARRISGVKCNTLERNIFRPALERNILRPALERNSKLRTQNSELKTQMYCARILIESARFLPLGFDTVEISSKSNF